MAIKVSVPAMTHHLSQAQELKEQANGCVRRKDYITAVERLIESLVHSGPRVRSCVVPRYSTAISLDGTDATFWNNRALCHFELGQYDDALDDASTGSSKEFCRFGLKR